MYSPAAHLKGKKVLITGGLGFIGSNLAHRLFSLGADITIYDNLDSHSGGNLYNVRSIKDSIKLVFYDLLNFDMLVKHVCDQELIFNCAASTSHPFSMREPMIDLDVNSRGVINLLEAIRRFNPEARLIHIGTSTQLGKLVYQPADEAHPEFPADIYSANKSVSEKYTLIYSRAYDMDATVIRFANVFGPRASIHSAEFTFNNYFVGLAMQNRDITIYGDGKQLRNVIYIDDAVEALIQTAQAQGTKGETYFAVSDKHYSVAEIAVETARLIGQGKVNFIPWPAERKVTEIGDAVLSNEKIRKQVQWSPLTSLQDGLIKTKEYYANHLEHYIH
jgi:UDP-glucose 4-epimerase